MILKELSEHNRKWKQIAYNICKDYDLANDIVQNMYIKLADKTKWNDYFVAITLKNLFLDHIKKQKDIRLNDFHYIADTTRIFEPNDNQQSVLNQFDKLKWYQKELILEQATGESLRSIQKKYSINYGFTFRETTEAKKIILSNVKK